MNLNNAPQGKPQFSTTIKNNQNQEVICADPNATRGLLAIMNMYSVMGGAACHWGGAAGLAEGMSALHSLMFSSKNWYENYNFVNDIGHAENGIYALRANLGFGDLTFESLKGFRSINSKLTGHGESHLYPEGVLLSNGPLGSSLGQAQGLAMSDKLNKNNRITISVISDGALMEGEAKESLASIPGFFNSNLINPFLLVISDNNTKLSGRIDQDSFSMEPSIVALEQMGWDLRTVEYGNDLEACYQNMEKALNDLKNNNKPIALVLKTIKGYGVKSTMDSASGGHGFPLKDADEKLKEFVDEIFAGKTPEIFDILVKELINLKKAPENKSEVKTDKIQAGFSKALLELKENNLPIVSLSSDLQGSTGVAPFHKAYPESSFDLGIAESNMVSVAAGFSKNGFIPVVDTFAAFGVTKGNLPLIMSRLSNCPMICLFTHTGMQDAADGASHQSTTYFSALSSIPGLRILNPGTKEEAYQLLSQAVKDIQKSRDENNQAHSYVFFAGREVYPEAICSISSLEQADIITKGNDLTIVATGPMIHYALKAAHNLEKKNISVEVINHSQINFPDTKTIGTSLKKTKNLITVEDHQLVGGMGSLLSHELKLKGFEFKLASVGISGHFGRSAYTADELYDLFDLNVQSIENKANELLK